MDNTPGGRGNAEGDADLSTAISKISLIESILGADQDIPSEVTFHLPLGDVLALFPPRCVKELTPDVRLDDRISITMDDLFAQLSKGKATMSVAKLAFFVPSHLLQKEAFADTTTMVVLPLPVIINAVGVDKLKNHMAKKVRHYKIDDIDDPFAKIFNRPAGAAAPSEAATPPVAAASPDSAAVPVAPASPVPLSAVEAAAEEIKPPAPAPAPAEVAPAKPRRRAADRLPPEQRVPEMDFHELPGNVNVNTASLEELLTLDGLSEPLAKRILDFRTQNGPLTSVFDLIKVPRLSRSVFKRITGMPFNSTGYHRRYKLAQWAHMPVDRVAELPLLAKAIAELPGFSGCILSDKDGLLLSQYQAEAYGENWGAIAIKVMALIREHVQLLNVGSVESVSLGIKGYTVTIVTSQNVVLTVIHQHRKLTATQLGLIHRIRQEVAWLLTRRAYVGP